MPHISIKAEKLFEVLGFPITNSFFTSLIVTALFFLLALYYFTQIKARHRSVFFYLIHFMVRNVHSFFRTVVGDKIDAFFPLIGALFFYILLQNWFGLLPGVGSLLVKPAVHSEVREVEHVDVTESASAQSSDEIKEDHKIPLMRANTADLNTTIALGILAVIAIQYYGFKYLGWDYLKKYINFKSPIDFVLGLLEIVSEFSRVISFAFRLFGNIFAGEVLIAIIAFLVPVLASFPFLALEIFVGFVQALVFSMLTTVFLGMATEKHH